MSISEKSLRSFIAENIHWINEDDTLDQIAELTKQWIEQQKDVYPADTDKHDLARYVIQQIADKCDFQTNGNNSTEVKTNAP